MTNISDLIWPFRPPSLTGPVSRLPRIGTIATMPSRLKTFAQVLPVVARQVDRLFVFLDGFETDPSFIKAHSNVTVVRSQDTGDYHSSGRFLCLQYLDQPAVVFSLDDDIHYPSNYVLRLVAALERFEGKAVVGVHGTLFLPPFTNYVSDRKCFHFQTGLLRFRRCDELGAGTTAFCTDTLNFDMKAWPTFRSDDGYLALEAKQRNMALWCVPRWRGWLRQIPDPQAFSIWGQTLRDPCEKTALMRRLMSERVAEYDAKGETGA